MSHLRCHIRDYLALRRALGFRLEKEGRLLPDFAAFAEAAGTETVTVDLAVRWAAMPEGASPVWAAQRLSMVRGFARYLQTVDPAAQVPPADLLPARTSRGLLVSATGMRLCQATVQPAFRRLLRQAGIGQGTPRSRPVIHGLRHTFAVKTLLGWYRDGQDVQARMPALSTYLGHAGPAATYWYLTATPGLLALAARRLEATTGGAP